MLYDHLVKFGGHRYCSSRDMCLVCHVIKQDHLLKGSDDYKDSSPQGKSPTYPSLVAIGTVILEI